jgi:hypothetical protein
MKQSCLTALTISGLLVSLVVGMQAVEVVKANFVPYGEVSMISPANQTYNSNFLILNFTAIFSVTTTKSITYSIDGQPEVTIIGLQYSGDILGERTKGTISLPYLSDGPHLLEMYAKTNSTPVLPGTGYSSVCFTINSTTQSQTPTISLSSSVTSEEVVSWSHHAIIIESPDNHTIYQDSMPLNLTVEYLGYDTANFIVFQYLTGLSYSIDNKSAVTLESYYIGPNSSTHQPYKGMLNISDLSNGQHQIVITASFLVNVNNDFMGDYFYASAPIYFAVYNTPPTISNLSVENKTYISTEIPLNFNINETISWIGYGIDDQPNVTVTGNTTLSGLSNGSHRLTIYANDTAGNLGKSDAVFFTVNTQPSSSPTQQPTLEPSPTSSNTQTENFASTIIILSIVAGAVIIALLAYLAKHKGWK